MPWLAILELSLLRMRLRRREQRIRELEEEVDDNAIEEGGEEIIPLLRVRLRRREERIQELEGAG